MVTVKYSNSKNKDVKLIEQLDDYTAERLFLKLSGGSVNPAVLNEGDYTLENIEVNKDNVIYDSVVFIP